MLTNSHIQYFLDAFIPFLLVRLNLLSPFHPESSLSLSFCSIHLLILYHIFWTFLSTFSWNFSMYLCRYIAMCVWVSEWVRENLFLQRDEWKKKRRKNCYQPEFDQLIYTRQKHKYGFSWERKLHKIQTKKTGNLQHIFIPQGDSVELIHLNQRKNVATSCVLLRYSGPASSCCVVYKRKGKWR